MKKALKIFLFLFLILGILMFVGASVLADLRTEEIKNNTQSEEQIAYAQAVLQKAIKKQGWIK